MKYRDERPYVGCLFGLNQEFPTNLRHSISVVGSTPIFGNLFLSGHLIAGPFPSLPSPPHFERAQEKKQRRKGLSVRLSAATFFFFGGGGRNRRMDGKVGKRAYFSPPFLPFFFFPTSTHPSVSLVCSYNNGASGLQYTMLTEIVFPGLLCGRGIGKDVGVKGGGGKENLCKNGGDGPEKEEAIGRINLGSRDTHS